MTRYLGIDPGFESGAIVWADDCRPDELTISLLPADETQLYDCILRIATGHSYIAYVEKMHAMPNSKRGSVASASLMRCYGSIITSCYAASVRVRDVLPTTWQREFGLIGKEKKEHVVTIKRRRPTLPWTLRTCDAGLLYDYALLAERGEVFAKTKEREQERQACKSKNTTRRSSSSSTR